MGAELVLARRPEPVTINIGARWPCSAKDCERQVQGHIVWFDSSNGLLHREDVCGWHIFRLKGKGMHFPLNRCPDISVIGHAVDQHLQQQQRASFQQYRPTMTWNLYTQPGGFSFTNHWG